MRQILKLFVYEEAVHARGMGVFKPALALDGIAVSQPDARTECLAPHKICDRAPTLGYGDSAPQAMTAVEVKIAIRRGDAWLAAEVCE